MKYTIGVDLGGSHVAAGIVDLTGKIFGIEETKVNSYVPPEITLKLVKETIQKLISNHPAPDSILGVGIGMPGNHDSAQGICRFSPNFPEWHNVQVTSFLSQGLGLKVWMLNDVRVATLGEYHFGAGQGAKSMVMMAIGTGIGGGIILNGKLVMGENEAAGEIGHMTVQPNGPLCNCGNRGCVEILASGPSISARGAEAILHGKGIAIRKKINSLDEINPKAISDAANEGDTTAQRILKEAGQAIGLAISNLAVSLNPERFVLGGGVAQAGEHLFQGINEEIKSRVFIFPAEKIQILPAKLGVRAGLIGAATYAFLQNGIEP